MMIKVVKKCKPCWTVCNS